MEENRLPYETLKIGDTEYKLKISASSAIEIEKKKQASRLLRVWRISTSLKQ